MPREFDVDVRRRNFVEKVIKKFEFLCTDFGYRGPEHLVSEQANGSVTRDMLTYRNAVLDRQITFYNAYHPVDYGFELQFFRPSVGTEHSQREMVCFFLKEQQDDEQSYLDEVLALLKDDYRAVISGDTWVTND